MAGFQSRTHMEANQRNAWRTAYGCSVCRPVAMEAICRTAVFPKSDTNGGEPEERTVDGFRCELLPSGPPTPWWSGFAATRFPHRRDGGDLSTWVLRETRDKWQVSKVGHTWRRTRGTHGTRHSLRAFAVQGIDLGVVGAATEFRTVAMEANCQPGYYVRRRT